MLVRNLGLLRSNCPGFFGRNCAGQLFAAQRVLYLFPFRHERPDLSRRTIEATSSKEKTAEISESRRGAIAYHNAFPEQSAV